MRPLHNNDLYNCCTGCIAPDWSQFSHLEISGSREDTSNRGATIGGLSAVDAKFFTVYGAYKGCNEVVPITDVYGVPGARDQANGGGPARRAFVVAAALSRISGLPVIIKMMQPAPDVIPAHAAK